MIAAILVRSVPAQNLESTDVEVAQSFQQKVKQILVPAFSASCNKCHGSGDEVKGDVNLRELEHASDFLAQPDLLHDVIEALDSNAMPPDDEPEISEELRQSMIKELKSLLSESVRSAKAVPSTPIRRMNRFQYSNSVRDLLKLDRDVFALPERMMREYGNYFQPAQGTMPDQLFVGSRPLGKSQLIEKRFAGVTPFPQDLRAEHGFDNQGDHLSLSPILMESFLKLSRSIVDSYDFHEKSCGAWSELFAEPEEDQVHPMVRQRMENFLNRAFRGNVDGEIVDRYSTHVIAKIDSGSSFVDSMKSAVSAAIASPRFLYLFDRDASSGTNTEAFNLATRLSFFLWGSIPDDELLSLAESGKLLDQETLTTQIDRMLNNRKSKRFCESFSAQWLQMDRIISSQPDPDNFKDFYWLRYNASMHMMVEPLLLFETVYVENRPLIDLIDPDFTYRSQMLHKWYSGGRAGGEVARIKMQRFPIKNRREGGVIHNAAVMTMTSGTKRTKPITRGSWIATVIFNDPPDPPPADVPPLPESGDEIEKLTLRERIKQHRENESCAGCHAKIDPLGFAFEHYDAVGRWREKYENGAKVNASGQLFKKHSFQDAVGFKDAVVQEKDRFAKGFIRHLLAFALARPISGTDSVVVDRIIEKSRSDDYRLRDMIKSVVLSDAFYTSRRIRQISNEKQ